MIKPKSWDGSDLRGHWTATRKLDGVRMLRDDGGNPVSRAGKPLHNLGAIPDHIVDAEIFIEDWETTVSAVRTHEAKLVDPEFAFSLEEGKLDPRLLLVPLLDPTAKYINELLELAIERGEEGLVLYGEGKCLKVKPYDNFDVVVQDVVEGKGKRVGCVGKLITPMGNVGIFKGFTEPDLRELWEHRHERLIGKTVEIECMELTKAGKFRHGKLVRERFDK